MTLAAASVIGLDKWAGRYREAWQTHLHVTLSPPLILLGRQDYITFLLFQHASSNTFKNGDDYAVRIVGYPGARTSRNTNVLETDETVYEHVSNPLLTWRTLFSHGRRLQATRFRVGEKDIWVRHQVFQSQSWKARYRWDVCVYFLYCGQSWHIVCVAKILDQCISQLAS